MRYKIISNRFLLTTIDSNDVLRAIKREAKKTLDIAEEKKVATWLEENKSKNGARLTLNSSNMVCIIEVEDTKKK